MQRMGSVPILSVNISVSITIDTMLKFDANTDANIDAHCKWTLIRYFHLTFLAAFTQLNVGWIACLLTISIFVTDSCDNRI